MTAPIRNISDTALWVAMYRAFESARPDALFRDPFARRLAGARGAAIVKALPRGRAMAWPMIVRTAVMDEIILRLVAAGAAAVVNLAAGLDARAYRLQLPSSLRWFDVDLPGMVEYRTECLADAKPACLHEHLAADLADAGERERVFSQAAAEGGRVLVVTEGLLIYLTESQVKDLATQLHRHREMQWWLIDLASPQLLERLSKSMNPHLAAGNAPMRFAPEAGTDFFSPWGWREAEFRPVWEESLRLRRSIPLARLWNLIVRIRGKRARESARKMSSIVLFERCD